MRAYGGAVGEIVTTRLDKLRPKSWHWIKSNIDKNTLMTIFNQLLINFANHIDASTLNKTIAI
jgi:hypothetical protein